jgi:hypothetical protein
MGWVKEALGKALELGTLPALEMGWNSGTECPLGLKGWVEVQALGLEKGFVVRGLGRGPVLPEDTHLLPGQALLQA